MLEEIWLTTRGGGGGGGASRSGVSARPAGKLVNVFLGVPGLLVRGERLTCMPMKAVPVRLSLAPVTEDEEADDEGSLAPFEDAERETVAEDRDDEESVDCREDDDDGVVGEAVVPPELGLDPNKYRDAATIPVVPKSIGAPPSRCLERL